MYDISFLLFLKYLLLNILLPFFPGLLFMWIFYGDKFKGFLLYLFAWFVGVGVIAFSLLNIQFIHFGIGILEYLIVLGILTIIFIGKLCIKKQEIKYYIQTLKIENIISQTKKSFISLSITEKVFTIIISIYSIYFICISGLFNFCLPTYAIDSILNRNTFSYNIYMDGGIKLFGDESEILGRGRLGYPIQIPTYKALIFKFMGGINDIYINIRQLLVFLFGLLFIFYVTFDRTKNIFKSVLPIGLIISLPLVFFHSFEGYMDLPLTFYCVISVWLFYHYLETKDFDYLSLGLLFGFISANIKNDGFVVYLPGLLFALFLILCLNKNLVQPIKGLWRDKNNFLKSIGFFIYFLIPFVIVKLINGLGFNQAGRIKSGIGRSEEIHWEIMPIFKEIFFKMDNYNIVLVILLLLIASFFLKKKKNKNNLLFLFTGLIIFLILISVFLFTVDYKYVLDMTTVNRVFTMCFIIILAFSGFMLDEK